MTEQKQTMEDDVVKILPACEGVVIRRPPPEMGSGIIVSSDDPDIQGNLNYVFVPYVAVRALGHALDILGRQMESKGDPIKPVKGRQKGTV